MLLRLIIVTAGVVALAVGIVGLLTTVAVSTGLQAVDCGSALAPDLSAAKSRDDGNPANVPVLDGVVTDPDLTRLCQMNLEDRRLWTITLAAVGALTAGGALAHGALSRRSTKTR